MQNVFNTLADKVRTKLREFFPGKIPGNESIDLSAPESSCERKLHYFGVENVTKGCWDVYARCYTTGGGSGCPHFSYTDLKVDSKATKDEAINCIRAREKTLRQDAVDVLKAMGKTDPLSIFPTLSKA